MIPTAFMMYKESIGGFGGCTVQKTLEFGLHCLNTLPVPVGELERTPLGEIYSGGIKRALEKKEYIDCFQSEDIWFWYLS
jgi:hypothetical protein